MPGTIKARTSLPSRVPLAEVLRVLGCSRQSFYRHWKGVFTPYTVGGGKQVFAEDELKAAASRTTIDEARGAVKQLRAEKGRG